MNNQRFQFHTGIILKYRIYENTFRIKTALQDGTHQTRRLLEASQIEFSLLCQYEDLF